MQTTGDRADFPADTAMSGKSIADSSGINGPFTVCDALMRERNALVYHRQMLKRKRTELEQSLQKQRSEKEVCPALFVFRSDEALLPTAQYDRVRRTLSAWTNVHTAPMLRRLELEVSELSEAIVQNISQLEISRQLECVSIRLHHVTPALKLLCNLTLLRSLDLSHTTITNEDLRGIQGCHNLVKLDLSYCDGVTDLSPITQIKTLEVVKVSKCYELRGVGILSRLPRLKELDLSENHITDKEVRLLSECHTLVKIDLSWCSKLTNVNALSSIATLEVISLSWCTSLIHVGELGKLPLLREGDLSRIPITDEEVRLLSKCQSLVKIDLNHCHKLINVNSLSSIATLEVINVSECTSLTHVGALGRLPVLKEVNLNHTQITDEEVRLLSECRTLVKIDLSWCSKLTNVNALSSIATLEVISLLCCADLTPMDALSTLPVLKEVNLGNTRITDEYMPLLSKCRTLVKIELPGCCKLTNVDPLSSMETLEAIDLSGSSLTHLDALSKLPVLKEVYLRYTRITDKEVCQLSKCRTLVKINLYSCAELTNVNPLSSIATLEDIDLTYCTSLTHLGELGRLPALKKIKLERTPITDEVVRLLSQSQSLVKIDLNHCHKLINVNSLSSIATLEVIDLSVCTSLTHVAALGKLSKLMSLSLFRTFVRDEEVDSLKSLRKQLGLPSIDIKMGVG